MWTVCPYQSAWKSHPIKTEALLFWLCGWGQCVIRIYTIEPPSKKVAINFPTEMCGQRSTDLMYLPTNPNAGLGKGYHNRSLIIDLQFHYSDVILSMMASQITGVSIACSTGCSGADQRKHQSSVSLAFVRRIHRWPVDSPHKGPITRKMLPFDYIIVSSCTRWWPSIPVGPIVFQGHPLNFNLNWAFLDRNSSFNSQVATKWCTKLEVA